MVRGLELGIAVLPSPCMRKKTAAAVA